MSFFKLLKNYIFLLFYIIIFKLFFIFILLIYFLKELCHFNFIIITITINLPKHKNCCKSKELERDKEETKREFRGNSDDFYFMLIRPIYRLIVRRPKAFT